MSVTEKRREHATDHLADREACAGGGSEWSEASGRMGFVWGWLTGGDGASDGSDNQIRGEQLKGGVGRQETPPTGAECEGGGCEAKARVLCFGGWGEGRGFPERRIKSRLDKAEHQAVDCEAVAVIEATAKSRRRTLERREASPRPAWSLPDISSP